MNNEQIYRLWKEQKGNVEISEDFSGKVMRQIFRYQEKKRKSLFDIYRLIDLISANTMAKAAMITCGAIAGFVRIAFMIRMVLFA